MRKVIIVFVIFMGFMDNIMAQNPDYLFMIENACKAPSGHNTQPWLFKIRESEIDIYPDLSKELPVVDSNKGVLNNFNFGLISLFLSSNTKILCRAA